MKIIITGASSGIGFSAVQIALEKGWKVLAIARSGGPLQELEAMGAATLQADISDSASFRMLEAKLEELKWGRVDALVNNAGFLVNKPFAEIGEAEFDQSIAVNFKAPYFLTQLLLPRLKNGQVLNISTMGGINGTAKFPGLSAYSSSKGGLGILTELLAEELSGEQIRVNALALGAVQTPMLEAAFPGYEAPTTPEQMGEFIIQFLNHTGAFFNGKVLPVSSTTP